VQGLKELPLEGTLYLKEPAAARAGPLVTSTEEEVLLPQTRLMLKALLRGPQALQEKVMSAEGMSKAFSGNWLRLAEAG